MKVFKAIVNTFIILLTLVMLSASIMLIYFKTFGADKIPSGVTSTHVTQMVDPLTGKTYNALETNYYANKNGTGYETIEFLINSYSGFGKQTIYSRGFQMVWDSSGNLVKYTDPSTGKQYDYFEYNRNNSGQSFITGHKYNLGDKMFIDINGTTYAVALDGTYQISNQYTDGWMIFRTVGTMGLNLLFEGTNFVKTETKTYEYTFVDLLIKIREIIRSANTGTGDSILSLVDLGDFLHVYEVSEDGQISAEPISGRTLNNAYFTTQTHYDRRGITLAEQSMFGSIAGDSNFNMSGIDTGVDYWQARTKLELSEADFTSRYSEIENGNYYYLSANKIEEIKSYTNAEVFIDINLDNLETPLGLDYYALSGVEINKLNIKTTSFNSVEFKVLYNALHNTGIEFKDISSSTNVELIDLTQEVIAQ